MKPILIASILFLSTFTKTFAANEPLVTPAVLKSFRATFASATEVGWSVTTELYKAVFLLNGQYVTAYFNADGSLQALVRHIAVNALPMPLQTALKAEHKNFWITDALEVTNDGSLAYYVTLEDAATKVVLKATSTTWSSFQKTHKD